MPLCAPRPTTFISAHRLSAALSADIVLASETFQYTGSFKYRAAFRLVTNVSHEHFIAASSGNFGQALAKACRDSGKRCTVVMPAGATSAKIEAVRHYGATVELIDVAAMARTERVRELAVQFPDAYVADPADDQHVIDGNATLGFEIVHAGRRFDELVVPIGGGALAAGIATALAQCRADVVLTGAEPLLGNDAARSLREGRVVALAAEPETIADGARSTHIGTRCFPILRQRVAVVHEVPEATIVAALRLCFTHANLKVEPTAALAVAAVMAAREGYAGKTVCCVVTGANTDAASFGGFLVEPGMS